MFEIVGCYFIISFVFFNDNIIFCRCIILCASCDSVVFAFVLCKIIGCYFMIVVLFLFNEVVLFMHPGFLCDLQLNSMLKCKIICRYFMMCFHSIQVKMIWHNHCDIVL